MNNNIHFITDNIYWASALAGGAFSATNDKKKENPGCHISFEPTTPEIERISDMFVREKGAVEVRPLNSAEYLSRLDSLAALRISKDMEAQHGAIVEPDYRLVQGYVDLARTLYLFEHEIICDPFFYYPRIPTKYDYAAVVECEEFIPYAEKYLEGFGAKGSIHVARGLMDSILAVNSPNIQIAVLRRNNELNVVLRSYYKDYDHIRESVPVLLLLDDRDMTLTTDRTTVSWPGQLAQMVSDGPDVAFQRGQTWRSRCDTEHDIFKHIRNHTKVNS